MSDPFPIVRRILITLGIVIGVLLFALLAVESFLQRQSIVNYIRSHVAIPLGLIPDPAVVIKQDLSHAAFSLESGNFEHAASSSRELLSTHQDAATLESSVRASSILASAQFLSGTQEGRLNAIKITKRNISTLHEAGFSKAEASQVNVLLGYIRSASEQYVYKEIFKGEPFKKLKVPENRFASIKNLAEYSLSLSPTTEAYYRIADYYLSVLVDPISESQKKAAIAAAVGALKKADDIYPQEVAAAEGDDFNYMIEMRRYLWESYVYGDLSLYDPQYYGKFEEMSQSMFDLYERKRDAEGNHIALIGARLPDVYINYARYLYAVKGSSEIGEVRNRLDTLISFVNENPSWHKGSYFALLQQMASKGLDKNKRSQSYEQYVALAAIHPPFKAFLKQHGWVDANF